MLLKTRTHKLVRRQLSCGATLPGTGVSVCSCSESSCSGDGGSSSGSTDKLFHGGTEILQNI